MVTSCCTIVDSEHRKDVCEGTAAQAEFSFTPQQTWQLVSVEKVATKCLED